MFQHEALLTSMSDYPPLNPILQISVRRQKMMGKLEALNRPFCALKT